jgi:hypothetical protein
LEKAQVELVELHPQLAVAVALAVLQVDQIAVMVLLVALMVAVRVLLMVVLAVVGVVFATLIVFQSHLAM